MSKSRNFDRKNSIQCPLAGTRSNQGPVVQNPIKPILDKWNILIVINLPLKEDFSILHKIKV